MIRGPVRHPVTAVVPVKPLSLAKSRLGLPDHQRRALALAFAVDTISALAESPLVTGVLVVTSDPVVARGVRGLPVRLHPDEGTGLGPAVDQGVRAALAWRPTCGVAVVPGDLPCLTAEDVTVLVTAGSDAGGAFVPDRSGTGTTLLICPPGRPPTTHYGPDSASLHRSAGLHPLEHAPVRARHDVDTVEDLHAALILGVGPQTAAAAVRAALFMPARRTSP